jgi:outer membrane receptor protein involved in Fe transport
MRKLTLSVSGVVAVLLTAPAAMFTPTPGYTQALEEITVTARKTAESLQEVPLAITALSGDDIERLNLQDLSDISQQDTSVQFDEGFTPSDTRITIRGLSPTRGRPNAATLIDGIDVTSEAVSNAGGSTLINPRLIDVERIEIVKGPQSALYGRSAFAGAVQYVTKDPGDTLQGDIFVATNSVDARELRGSVSIPITDTLGVLVNGYAWDERGIYKNEATQSYIGGGDGAGASLTFKWEPSDTVGIKWRTEFADDNFDVAAQRLLNDRNTLLDLSDITPGASSCNLSPIVEGDFAGQLGPGPLDDICGDFTVDPNTGEVTAFTPADKYFLDDEPGSTPVLITSETDQLTNFFFTDPNGTLGQYTNTLRDFQQYDKTAVSFFKGTIPDADGLNASLTPNYRNGIGAINPAQAEDFDGTQRKVFRTALKLDWAINDTLDFMSNTGYVDANAKIQTDIGKYYVDECSPDITALDPAYASALLADGKQLEKYAPCTKMTPDGINDAPIQFVQDDSTDTKQISQEFRLAWQASDSLNLTGGLQYWSEEVYKWDINSSAIAQGNQCALVLGNDAAVQFGDFGDNFPFSQYNTIQDRCSRTSLVVAYWMNDLYQGRLEQPAVTERETDHYSAYASLDWDLTDRLTTRFEARYVTEENSVTGTLQTPCLNGTLPEKWYEGSGTPLPGADEPQPCRATQPGINRTLTSNGGQGTGASTVIICGQIGACDTIGISSTSGSPWYAGNNPPLGQPNFNGDSWWAYGFRPQLGVAATPPPRTDRFWAPKATFEYTWSDDVLTYLSWSRGIKPGGFSLLTSGAFGLDANLDGNYDEIEFEPERLDVWEIGAKTTLFDGRVRLNGSAFFQDFKDKQVTVQKVVEGTTGTQVENISGSEVRGIEIDLTWQITQNWLASGGYTFLDSEYTDYTIVTQSSGDVSRINAGKPDQQCQELAQLPGGSANQLGCLMSFNGNDLERAPRNAWLVNLTYTNNLFDTGAEWYSEVNYRYQDSRFVEAFNIVQFPSYSLTDLRFGIQAAAWDLQLFVNNVFDNDAVISGGANPGIPTGNFGFGFSVPPRIGAGGPGINAGPKLPSDIYINLPNPRIVGINAKFRFGQ